MRWNQIEGRWEQLKGHAKATWGKLTDDDLMRVNGQIENLVGVVMSRYDVERGRAQRQVEEWAMSLED